MGGSRRQDQAGVEERVQTLVLILHLVEKLKILSGSLCVSRTYEMDNQLLSMVFKGQSCAKSAEMLDRPLGGVRNRLARLAQAKLTREQAQVWWPTPNQAKELWLSFVLHDEP